MGDEFVVDKTKEVHATNCMLPILGCEVAFICKRKQLVHSGKQDRIVNLRMERDIHIFNVVPLQ